MDFQGYLLKFGETVFPHYLMDFSGWSAVPNQRLNDEAERDLDMLLHMSTSPNFKTKITVKTRKLSLAEKKVIQDAINSSIIDEVERKCSVTYWNDETNEYVTGVFYVPDITYQIESITQNSINYAPLSFSIIEY